MGKLVTTLALTNDLMKSLVINFSNEKQNLPMKIFADGKRKLFRKHHNITMQTGEDQIIDIGNVIILRNILF
jgi:hypothetical protein